MVEPNDPLKLGTVMENPLVTISPPWSFLNKTKMRSTHLEDETRDHDHRFHGSTCIRRNRAHRPPPRCTRLSYTSKQIHPPGCIKQQRRDGEATVYVGAISGYKIIQHPQPPVNPATLISSRSGVVKDYDYVLRNGQFLHRRGGYVCKQCRIQWRERGRGPGYLLSVNCKQEERASFGVSIESASGMKISTSKIEHAGDGRGPVVPQWNRS